MNPDEEQRYCLNCGQPLMSPAEMFICWMCEDEERERLLEEQEESDSDEDEYEDEDDEYDEYDEDGDDEDDDVLE